MIKAEKLVVFIFVHIKGILVPILILNLLWKYNLPPCTAIIVVVVYHLEVHNKGLLGSCYSIE